MKRFLVFAAILTIVALACAPAFAFEFIVGAAAGSLNNATNYADSGFSASTGDSAAPSCPADSRYSGTTVYFGPSRFARASFNPANTGFYKIQLAWPNTAGQTDTSVTLYTGAETGGAADQWGNAAQQGVITKGTMDMYYKSTNVWNTFTTAQLTAGTAYKVGIYGGHKSLNAAPDLTNRVAIAGFRFASATPGQAVATGLNGGNELSWTAGEFNSFFDVWFGDSETTMSKIGTVDAATLSMGMDYEGLAPGTYFWRVDSGNLDITTAGLIQSFTIQAVPEPGSLLALGTGLIGLVAVIRRKRS